MGRLGDRGVKQRQRGKTDDHCRRSRATPGFTAVQNYDYDSLNRIQIASETLTPTSGTAESWVQEFKYDRYGNRKFNEQTTTTLPKECGTAPNLTVCPDDPKINPSLNPNTNRLVGYTFDAAGNTKIDAENRKFFYDGENKQTKVIRVNASEVETAKIGEYWYDGDGRRIKKRAYEDNVLTEETIFVYDAFGKLIGEYSNEIAAAQDAKVAYLTSDHLGSPRINTDANGAVIARHDYHPFGEEITTSKRSSGTGYLDDTIRKQFTGYERDKESDLNFAQARYIRTSSGRFSSPDPYNIVLEIKAEQDRETAKARFVAFLTKAQQWNRYTYVMNNPMIYRDPSGEILELTGTKSERDEAFNRILELCGERCGLYLREKDGHTFVEYFDQGGGPSKKVALIGQVLEDIIDTSTVVELQVTSKATITWADGDSENLSNRAALTRPISTDKIQIFISTTMSMEKLADTAHFSGVRGEDGSKISFTKSVQLAHELGHAWGAIVDRFVERYNRSWIGTSVINENNNRSVQVENWQRNRLGLTRRGNH